MQGSVVNRGVRKIAKEILKRTELLNPDSELRALGLTDAAKIPTHTRSDELVALFNIAASCPPNSTAIEIGSYIGASTCYIAAGLSRENSHLLCVDTWQNETMPGGIRDTFAEFQANTKPVSGRITTIRKRSDALASEEVPEGLAMAFLDGDHSFEATNNDFNLVAPKMSADGVIAFHDSMFYEGVSRVIGAALATGKWVLAGNVNNLTWIARAHWKPELH